MLDMVHVLVEAGAKTDLEDMYDRTPIQLARKCGRTDVVRFLEKYEVGGRNEGEANWI